MKPSTRSHADTSTPLDASSANSMAPCASEPSCAANTTLAPPPPTSPIRAAATACRAQRSSARAGHVVCAGEDAVSRKPRFFHIPNKTRRVEVHRRLACGSGRTQALLPHIF
eukprot:363116-Chlamydomonas_euryale.AAC.11